LQGAIVVRIPDHPERDPEIANSIARKSDSPLKAIPAPVDTKRSGDIPILGGFVFPNGQRFPEDTPDRALIPVLSGYVFPNGQRLPENTPDRKMETASNTVEEKKTRNYGEITAREAADYLTEKNYKVSPRTVERWVAGKGTPKDFPGLANRERFIIFAAGFLMSKGKYSGIEGRQPGGNFHNDSPIYTGDGDYVEQTRQLVKRPGKTKSKVKPGGKFDLTASDTEKAANQKDRELESAHQTSHRE
jgi:hypothetical protein